MMHAVMLWHVTYSSVVVLEHKYKCCNVLEKIVIAFFIKYSTLSHLNLLFGMINCGNADGGGDAFTNVFFC